MPEESFEGWLQRLENLIRIAGVTERIDRDAAFMAYDLEGKTAEEAAAEFIRSVRDAEGGGE
ncbi:MAG: hypothetical protein SFW67_25780 [Myxococcaceae bacterium]|nr:hypothetical protein [Myxococcaceae bacterium]